MLQLYNKNKNKIAGLIEYKDLSIESILNTGDKTLTFTYHKAAKFYEDIEEEAYIQTKTDEFVIKAKEVQDDETTFTCTLNVEDLEGHIIDRFESKEQTIESALNLALVNTGWIIENCDIKRKRTVRMSNSSSWDIIQEIKKTYRVEIQFDTLNKKINVYEHIGSDKGTYFIDSLNLTALSIQSNSYDFATRIIPVGKNGLTIESINNGKLYIENYQYSNKVKTIYWKDERYTIAEDLKEDAEAKLNEISKPYRAYSASIINLAQINDKYKNILDYKLGDTITLISKDAKIREKQRIVKIKEYPNDHSRDTIELANAILKFEDIQKQFKDTSDTVDNITSDNGTVDGSTVDSIKVKQIEDFKANVIEVTNLEALNANISDLNANKADIQELNAVRSNIGTLNATKADITELNSVKASLKTLQADKADVTTLNAAVERVGILEGKTLSVENQLAGNLTAKNFKANSITAESGIIAEGAIGSAQISDLELNKLRAGDISTSKFRIISANGSIQIVGNQLLVNRDNINRVVLGEYRKQDNTTDYGLLIRSEDGKTIILDGEGVHNAGITDGAINNNKVADNANISGNKLDINSVIREVNGATETIKGTRVQVGDRTLDVELSTQKNTITGNSKELSNQKATIQALDNAIKLKVDNQTFTQSTTTINSNINNINSDLIGKINASLNNAKSYADNSANNAKQSAILNANNYTNTVKQEAINQANKDTDNKINNMQIGGRNLLSKDDLEAGNLSGTDGSVIGGTYTNFYRTKRFIDIDNNSKYFLKINKAKEGDYIEKIIAYTSDNKFISAPVINSPETIFTPPSNCTKIKFVVILVNATSPIAENFEIKLEKGNKATDWTPSPEDLKEYSDNVAKAKADLAQANAIANADGKITAEEQKRINEAKKNLDTAITKANEAESKAKSYADTKKQEAINSASTDATNKANNALNNAKSYTNAQITTTNSNLSKVTSEINILKNQISSKVGQVDIDRSVNNIQIGGRNLIKNSDVLQNLFNYFNTYRGIRTIVNDSEAKCGKQVQFKCTTGGSGFHLPLFSKTSDKIGKTYTWSFWAKCSVTKSGNIGHECSGQTRVTFTTGWQKFSHTWTFTDSTYSSFTFYLNWNVNEILYIRDFKIEEGTKATDWTPAPEDVSQAIVDNIKMVTDKINDVSTKLVQAKDSLQASVNSLSSTTQTITTNLTTSTNNLNSKISSAKTDAINSAKTYADSVATSKSNEAKNQAINSANSYTNTAKADAIKQANSNTTNAINSISIGGRNLIRKDNITTHSTTKVSYDEATNTYTLKAANGADNTWGAGIAIISNNNAPIPYGRDYICSFEILVPIDCNWNVDHNFYPIGANSWQSNDNDNVSKRKTSSKSLKANVWTKCWYSTNNSHASNTNKLDIKDGSNFGIINNSGKDVTFKIRNIKGELATTPSEWTPAPEDVQKSIDTSKTDAINHANTVAEQKKNEAISSANSHADSIAESKSNEALNNAKTYTNAQITTVNTRISNTESSINVLKNQISTKVSQSDIDKSIQNIKIGGRNLALGTANPISLSNFNGGTNYCSNPYKVIHIQDCKEGDILTISYDLEYTNLSRQANGTFYLHGWGDITGWSGSANIIDNPSMDRIIWNSKDKEILKVVSYMKVNTTTLKDTSVNLRIRTDYLTGGSFTIKNFKVEKSKNISDWTVAPEDVNQAITDNVKTVTEKINTVESTFTQKTDNINATVNSVQSILKTKADGSTVSSMQSQLSSLNLGLDGIKTEVSKKTDKSSIISSINQSAEKIKIDASKIELNGITTFSDNGIKAVEVKNNSVRLFNWNKNGEFIGMLTSAVLDKDNSKPIMNLVNRKNSASAIGYTENDINFKNYITFDKFGVVGNTVPIGLNEDVSLKGSVMYFADSKKNSIFENTNEKIIVKGKHGLAIIDTDSGNTTAALDSDRAGFAKWNQRFYYAEFSPNAFSFGDGNGKSYMWKNSDSDIVCVRNQLRVVSNNGNNFLMDVDSNSFEMADSRYNKPYLHFGSNNFEFYDATNGVSCFWKKGNEKKIWTGKGISLGVQGDLTVSGKKNRVVETSYGNLTLNAVESAECWFTDMLIDQSKTDSNGDCIIWFDNKFLQTVNTRYKYKIDVTPLGEFASNGKLTYVRVVEKTEKYFKVRGTPDTPFDWTITAKQKGYERDRLEKTS